MAPPNPRGLGVLPRPSGLGAYSTVSRREDDREEPREEPVLAAPAPVPAAVVAQAQAQVRREVFAPVDVTKRMESAPERAPASNAPIARVSPTSGTPKASSRDSSAATVSAGASRLAVLGALFVFFVSAVVFAWALKTRLPHRARATEMERAPSSLMGAVARR
jgi:hypothetical protein